MGFTEINALQTRTRKIGNKAVPAAGEFTFELPVSSGKKGINYHAQMIRCEKAGGALLTAGEILTDIDRVEIEINGKVKVKMTAALIQKEQGYYEGALGGGHKDGILLIDHAMKHLQNIQESYAYRWGTHDVETLVVRVVVKDVTALTNLVLQSEVDNQPEIRLAPFKTVSAHQVSNTAAGEHVIVKEIPFKNRKDVVRIDVDAAECESGELKINEAEYQTLLDKDGAEMILERCKRTPMTDMYTFEPGRHNTASSFLSFPVNEFEMTLNMSGEIAGSGYNIFVTGIEHVVPH